MLQANVWWTIPNITSESKLNITFPGGIDTILSIPKGLYTVGELNSLIQRHCLINSRPGEITLTGNAATNKVVFSILTNGTSITVPQNSIWKILGVLPDAPIENKTDSAYVFEAPQVANFDTLQYLNITTTLVDNGIRTGNGRYNGCIARLNLDASPGYQIIYQPNQPLEIPTQIFQSRTGAITAKFELLDQNMVPVDTNGQTWNLLLRLRYFV